MYTVGSQRMGFGLSKIGTVPGSGSGFSENGFEPLNKRTQTPILPALDFLSYMKNPERTHNTWQLFFPASGAFLSLAASALSFSAFASSPPQPASCCYNKQVLGIRIYVF
jgi:hypothetical protein